MKKTKYLIEYLTCIVRIKVSNIFKLIEISLRDDCKTIKIMPEMLIQQMALK